MATLVGATSPIYLYPAYIPKKTSEMSMVTVNPGVGIPGVLSPNKTLRGDTYTSTSQQVLLKDQGIPPEMKQGMLEQQKSSFGPLEKSFLYLMSNVYGLYNKRNS